MMLANIDYLTEQIDELTARIKVLCEPYLRQIASPAIPGYGVITAQDMIAEIGTDMTVFPDGAHLASWARRVPQVTSSGGKRKGKQRHRARQPLPRGRRRRSRRQRRTHQTFLGTKYHKMCKRMPKRKAQRAIGRSQLFIYHDLLSDPGAEYTDLGPGYYEQRCTSPARSAATPAPSNATATKSPSKPSTRTRNRRAAHHQSQLTRPPPQADDAPRRRQLPPAQKPPIFGPGS